MMTKYLYPILLPCIAVLLCACGQKPPPAEKKISPASVLDRYAAKFVQQHEPEIHGHSAPMQTQTSPLSYTTQFFTKVPSMLTTPGTSSYAKNLTVTEKWQGMYCTGELQAHLRETGVAIASAQLIDSATGQKHSLAICLAGEPASAAATAASPVFSLASLDSGKVDPGSRGVDPAVLVRALEGIMAIEKGEFESTPDFTQRKSSLLSNKITGEYGIDDAFPFIVEVGKYASCLNGIRYAYDADRSRATLHLSAWSEALGGRGYSYSAYSDAPKYDTLELRRDDEIDKSYIGVNAFGVSTPVKVSRGVKYQVASKKIPYIKGRRPLSCEETKAAFAWQVDPAVAEKELPSLKAMLIVKLKPPYVLYSDYYREPTRDDPIDIEVQTRAVHGDIVKVVVYSGITGNIISQFPQ